MLCVLLGHALVVLALLSLTQPPDRVSPEQSPALQFVSLPLYVPPIFDEFPEPRDQQPRVNLAPPPMPSGEVDAEPAAGAGAGAGVGTEGRLGTGTGSAGADSVSACSSSSMKYSCVVNGASALLRRGSGVVRFMSPSTSSACPMSTQSIAAVRRPFM